SNRVAFSRVSFLSNPQCIQLRLENTPIDHLGGFEFISHEVAHCSLRYSPRSGSQKTRFGSRGCRASGENGRERPRSLECQPGAPSRLKGGNVRFVPKADMKESRNSHANGFL